MASAAIKEALRDIEASFGKGAVARLGDAKAFPKVEAIPTGAITLDLALGIGGIPRGRIVEIFGPESSGKTTLLLHILTNAQRMFGPVAFIDAEHALDPFYARAIGLQVDDVYVSQPDYGEQALEIADRLLKSGGFSAIAVDSVAALTPRAELAGEMGDQTVGLQARMMSQAMRKLAGNANKTKTALLFTNQIREKVGVLYGSPETQPGGRALRFYASQRLDVRRVSAGSDKEHNRVKVTAKKNKVAPPFQEAEFDIDFGAGISTAGCLLDVGVEKGVLVKKGGRHAFVDSGELIDISYAKCKARLNAEPELMAELDRQVREALGLTV